MGAYLLRRLLYIPVVLLVASFLAFAILQLQPGDCLADLESRSPESAQRLREDLGLNRPLWTQYLLWWRSVFQGTFGLACTGTPVTAALFGESDWIRSLLLAATALLLSWGIGVPLGLYSALRRGWMGDRLVRSAGTLSLATPHFLAALFLTLLLFSLHSSQWGLDPAGGVFSDQYRALPWSWGKLLNGSLHFLRPLLVIVLVQWAILMRHMRAYLLDVFNQPYIQVARSKGLPERQVNYKHALRNALHPLIGLMGFWLPVLFECNLAVAIVMDYPTVELNLYKAIEDQDPYVVAGGIFVLGGILMVGNLLADVALAWLDPRIRYE